MKELFKAVRTDACNIYKCEEKTKPPPVIGIKQTPKQEKEQWSKVLC